MTYGYDKKDLGAVGKYIKPLELFHVVVTDSINKAEKAPQGFLDTLKIISGQLRKTRALTQNERPRKIGVFGPPKRGKSSLLNVFLGAEILPTGTMPTTHCSVEIYNLAGKPEEKQRVVLYRTDGSSDVLESMENDDDFKEAIEQTFKIDTSVERIHVYKDFSGGSIPENSILVDTPGGEVAFEDSSEEKSMGNRGEELHTDTKRALQMLQNVDIVLFCMRGDNIGSKTEKDFYHQYMRLEKPINIINFKDDFDEDEQVEVLKAAVREYSIRQEDTMFVSAKEGQEAIQARQSLDFSGFTKLASAINERLSFFEPAECMIKSVRQYNAAISDRQEFRAHNIHVQGLLKELQSAGLDEIQNEIEKSAWFKAR